jgi:sugar-specific transcriptional regulator TrmB
MVEETKSQLSIIFTISGLMRADQFGLLDAAFNHTSKTNSKFRFITELTGENLKAIKQFLERIPKDASFEGRTPELGLKPISRMLIRDDAEAAFFVNQESDSAPRDPDDLCLWTNSNTIVDSFKTVFEDLWHNSIGIEKRIAEIETGKPTAKTYVIGDTEAAEKKYNEALNAAKAEIAIMTSAADLVAAFEKIGQLKEKAKNGVSVKIMAPITRDNLDAAQRLSEYCSVKHIPASHLETTIVDKQHLFQFKSAESSREKTQEAASFENVLYTNDLEYIEKNKSMFEEIWKHAIAPSPLTVEQITKPSMPSVAPVPDDEYTVSRKDSVYHERMEEIPGAITEEYILNKMINAKRIPARYPWKEPVIMYGYNASAVIHLPRSFNLPDMCLGFYHFNKHSSSELEDSFQVYFLLETPKGMTFVPVAIATDNPEGLERWKLILAGTPAGQNIHLLKKDELQVQLYGSTLFAGWTVPIPLFPPQYTLPPGGILVEGYGKLKTAIHKMKTLSGVQFISEDAGFDAFVTFFHPDSKYSGPGTDGLIGTNMILTAYPPPTPKSNQKAPDKL